MQTRGPFAKGLLIALAIVLIPVTAVSAQKITPGSSCKVFKQKVVYQNKAYTCIKSGTKLVWNKGEIVVVSTPTPSPGNSSVEQLAPTSFSNLYERRKAIAYTAWKLTSDAISQGKSSLKTPEIIIGPNTKPSQTPALQIFELVSKAFSMYKTPDIFYEIQYSFEDISWAEEKLKSLIGSYNYDAINANENGHLVDGNCMLHDILFPQNIDCGGAKQITTVNGIAVILLSIPKVLNFGDPMTQARSVIGQGEAHEFFHSLQRMVIGNNGWTNGAYPPPWVIEGGAEVTGNLVMSRNSFSEYLKWRRIDTSSVSGKQISYLQNYLDAPTYNYDGAYSYGSLVMETLVALKGPGVLLELCKQTDEKGFEPAFFSIFGTTWKDAKPIIAKIIYENFRSDN
ncbi:hypothetical protein MCERE8_00408 [Candidatus Nanopelagicaceae bacterium]